MHPFDRQLDRARPVSAPAQGPPARPPGGSAHQAGTASPGCICGHSPVAHRRYRECETPGCTCWAYRKTTGVA